jgi:hypothetical protein
MPAISACGEGWWCKFIMGANLATGNIVIDLNGSDTLACTGATAAAAALANMNQPNQINLIAGNAKIGDVVEMISDGSKWYGLGIVEDNLGMSTS